MISLATDCSGMETPIMALKNLGVEVDHLFSCDVNRHVRTTIMANFPPKVFYDDLTKRDNSKAAAADVYIAGFPCQPFSTAGKQQGFDDELGRGTIFFKVRDYIKAKSPKVFILENVIGLLRLNGGEYFEAIMKSLHGLGKYNITYKVMNTKDHGIPQNRKRLYFVGIHKSHDKGTFEWPEVIGHRPLEEFLEPRKVRPTKNDAPPRSSTTAHSNVKAVVKLLEKQGHDPLNEPWIVDCDSTFKFMSYNKTHSLCITTRRPSGHWITNRGRYMTTGEMMGFQGMWKPQEGFKVAVSLPQLGKQVGNAMSVNVLERIFVRVLPAAGLVPAKKLHDRWEAAAVKGAAPSTPSRALKRLRSGSPEKQERTLKRLRRIAPEKAARKA